MVYGRRQSAADCDCALLWKQGGPQGSGNFFQVLQLVLNQEYLLQTAQPLESVRVQPRQLIEGQRQVPEGIEVVERAREDELERGVGSDVQLDEVGQVGEHARGEGGDVGADDPQAAARDEEAGGELGARPARADDEVHLPSFAFTV